MVTRTQKERAKETEQRSQPTAIPEKSQESPYPSLALLSVPCPAGAPRSGNLTGTERAREPIGVVHTESAIQGTKKNARGEGRLISKWSQSV